MAVLLTSLNHWRDPRVTGWRRNLDLVCVQLGTGYHFYRSLECVQPYRSVTHVLWAAAIACYANAIRNGLKRNFNTAAWCHSAGLHCIGNVACCILYYGLRVRI